MRFCVAVMAMQTSASRAPAVPAHMQHMGTLKQGSSCIAWSVLSISRNFFHISPPALMAPVVGGHLARCPLRGGGFQAKTRSRPFFSSPQMGRGHILDILRGPTDDLKLTSDEMKYMKGIKASFEKLKFDLESEDTASMLHRIRDLLLRCRSSNFDHTLPSLIKDCIDISHQALGRYDAKLLALAATVCSEKGLLKDALHYIETMIGMGEHPTLALCNRMLLACLRSPKLDKLHSEPSTQPDTNHRIFENEPISWENRSAFDETFAALRTQILAWDRMMSILELTGACGHQPNEETYFLLLL
jgi:hypothetical protein